MPLIIIAVMVVVSLTLISYSVVASRSQQRELVSRRLRDAKTAIGKQKGEKTLAGRWFKEKAAPVLAKPAKPKSASEQSTLRLKLANAGIRNENTPTLFLASKSALGLTLGVLVLLASASSGHDGQKIFGMTVFAAGCGFMLPDLWLRLAISSRAEKITHGLPDCLDLMVISVEAGLGLDAALQRVSQEMNTVHPELAEEFTLTTMEVQMGIARGEALKNLAGRAAVPEIKSLTAMLIQAEKFGTSIANALRIHSDTLRTKRRQQAEERAAKTAVKLILPLILFIFPAIFVVLAGPAVLKLAETLTSGVLTGG